ncbi:MAG: hypothetical protein U0798_06365 [Gemmataceae bacterium]
MSFREKSAWVCLFTTLIVYVPYFVYIFGIASRDGIGLDVTLGSFIVAVVVQAVLQAGLAIALRVTAKPEPKDERDAVIDGRAVRLAYYVLVVGGFVVVPLFLTLWARPESRMIASTVLLAQLFLFCFVLAEVSRFTVQIVGYRRGA